MGPPVRIAMAFRAEPEQTLTHGNAQKRGSKEQGDALPILFHIPLCFNNIQHQKYLDTNHIIKN